MENKMEMPGKLSIWNIGGWLFGILLVAAGILNVFLVHPVPGVIYLLLSLLYLPPASNLLQKKIGFPVPLLVKIVLGVVLFFFTLGVSDLGDIIDKL